MLTVTDEVLVVADYNTTATPLTLTSLSPATVASGHPGFTLTLNGTGFTPSSVVSVNGTFPSVNFISSTQLSVAVTAAQVAQPGAFQVWVENFPAGAICAAFAALPFTVSNRLTSVVSRLTHGGAGPLDINLSLTGPRSVEPRSSTALGAGNYALVFTFANNLTSVASASVTGGTGTALSTSLGQNPNQCTVSLTNVSNGQYLTVTLNSVLDAAGNSGNITGPQMGVLTGDTNGDGVVNSGDALQTRSRSGQVTDGINFRSDVNADGFVNSGDSLAVRSRSGTFLP